MNDVVLALAADLAVEPILERLVEASRQLVGARYAALGVPDGAGGFARFITSGISDKQREALGDLPRQHGLLGAMLHEHESYRTVDIQQDPRFEGWPPVHPSMRSFLGVPILSKGEVIGAFYLTDKAGGFDEADQELIETLAAHAAIALENARLYEESRELSVLDERSRLARELHDSVTQTLTSVVLIAEMAGRLFEAQPEQARERIATVVELSRAALTEMRGLVFELRPPELDDGGITEALRKHVTVLARVHGVAIDYDACDSVDLPSATERELYRIAQEALANAVKHAGATRLAVDVGRDARSVTLCVTDDGCGFDPETAGRGKHLGLVSMRERTRALGGDLRIESKPGAGTTIRLELPA
jgi:signal transduction histidine kinase